MRDNNTVIRVIFGLSVVLVTIIWSVILIIKPEEMGAQGGPTGQTALQVVLTIITAALPTTIAAGAGSWTTWQKVRADQQQQLVDGFSSAVEDLWNGSLGKQLGGLYTLERIGWNDKRERQPILEVLEARKGSLQASAPSDADLLSKSLNQVTDRLQTSQGQKVKLPKRATPSVP